MRKVGRTEVEQWCAEVDIVDIMHCGEAYVNVARTVKWGLPQVGTRQFACHLHCWRGIHDVIFLECVTSASIFRKTALTTFFQTRVYIDILTAYHGVTQPSLLGRSPVEFFITASQKKNTPFRTKIRENKREY